MSSSSSEKKIVILGVGKGVGVHSGYTCKETQRSLVMGL
jgi:hypothetical protein